MSNNDYQKAANNASEEVRKLVDNLLDNGLPNDLPLLYAILGSGTPPYKMSKNDSDYTNDSNLSQRCSNCEYAYKKVVRDRYICSQIRGPIEPKGWCRLWQLPKDS